MLICPLHFIPLLFQKMLKAFIELFPGKRKEKVSPLAIAMVWSLARTLHGSSCDLLV